MSPLFCAFVIFAIIDLCIVGCTAFYVAKLVKGLATGEIVLHAKLSNKSNLDLTTVEHIDSTAK